MEQSAIFGPVYCTMTLTLVVWVFMYAKRIPFLQSLDTAPDDLTPGLLDELQPRDVANPSDNLKNLFEMPVLFYALALMLFVTERVDTVYVAAAWGFAGFRVLHSAVHCTANIVMLRFVLYALSSVALFFMLLRAAASHVFG